jgi:hypothetical protein
LLAALICVPIVLIVEIAALGSIPYGRPLRWLTWVQVLLAVAAGWLAWRQRRALADALTQMKTGLGTGWRESNWAQRGALPLGLLVQLTSLAYGAWNVPVAWDELAYHVPQAVQPYQDGRLGPVQANVIWADSYPRGVTLLYYWTLQITHTDAGFHPVNATFGFLFMLAAYVAALRLGLSRGWAWLAAGILPSTPIFWYLGTIGYIDLSVGGALAVMLSMCLPERDGTWTWGSCVATLLAAILALWMKFPPIAVICVALAFRGMLLGGQRLAGWFQAARPRPRPGPVAYTGATVLALGLASIPYLRTWSTYGSPVYPLRLRIGATVLIDGPMDTTRFQRMNDLPLLQRYSAFWSGWYGGLSADAPGSFGPLFTLIMVGAALACLLGELGRWQPGWLFMVLSFWLVMVLPEHHVPRYAVFISCRPCFAQPAWAVRFRPPPWVEGGHWPFASWPWSTFTWYGTTFPLMCAGSIRSVNP